MSSQTDNSINFPYHSLIENPQLKTMKRSSGSVHSEFIQMIPQSENSLISDLSETWNLTKSNLQKRQQNKHLNNKCQNCLKWQMWSRQYQKSLRRIQQVLISKERCFTDIVCDLKYQLQEKNKEIQEIKQKSLKLQENKLSTQKISEIKELICPLNNRINKNTQKINLSIQATQNTEYLKSSKFRQLQQHIKKIQFENSTLKSYNQVLLEKLKVNRHKRY